jgi:membrane protease subunit HflC
MKRNLLTLSVGVLLLAIFFVLLFVFQVRKSEVAVVTRFGAPVRDQTEPGPYLKWPWPIEKVYWFDQRIQNFQSDPLDEALTADNFNLIVQVYLGWRIADPKTFFPKFPGGSVAAAENALKSRVRTAKNGVIGKHPLADLVNADEKQLKFDLIEKEIQDIVRQEVAANNFGVTIDFLGLKAIRLPESVTTAVFDRMKSEREVLTKRSEAEGEAEAQKIRSNAEREAADMLATADQLAKEIRGKGEAEAAKSLAVFQQNPGLANFLFRLEALENSLKDRSTLIFDHHTPPFDLFRGPVPATNVPSR